MAGGARTSVTSLLEQVRSGGRADLNQLIEAVYAELRRHRPTNHDRRRVRVNAGPSALV